MDIQRLIAWEEAVWSNAFGDALHRIDTSFLKPPETVELHRLMAAGWIREAIVLYIATRFLAIHSREPDFSELTEVVLHLVGQEPALTADRSTPLVVAIASTLAIAAWRIRAYNLEIGRN